MDQELKDAAMYAQKCRHLVSGHEMTAGRLCSSVRHAVIDL